MNVVVSYLAILVIDLTIAGYLFSAISEIDPKKRTINTSRSIQIDYHPLADPHSAFADRNARRYASERRLRHSRANDDPVCVLAEGNSRMVRWHVGQEHKESNYQISSWGLHVFKMLTVSSGRKLPSNWEFCV